MRALDVFGQKRCEESDGEVLQVLARVAVADVATAEKASGMDGVFSRRLYRDVLPPAIIAGEKRGFGVPLDEWFRGPLRDFLFDTLSPGRCLSTGMLNPEPVGLIMAEHCRGDRNHGKALMSLLSLQRWAEGGN